MIQSALSPQTNSEALLLEQCESIISQGLRELIKLERAFAIIEKQKLYKNKHHNFEDYCFQNWSGQKELHYLCCFQKNKSITK